jgi:flagellin-like protein
MATCSKKGITPIVAIILIIMITVAAAGAMFFWITRIQNQGQGAVENSQSMLLERMATCVDIPSMTLNVLSNRSKLAVQNCGTSEFKLGDGDDNILMTSEPCSFVLNCSMIVSSTCPMTMLPGTFTRLDLDMNAATCSGTTKTAAQVFADQAGITHQIILSVDRKTTAARSFVPDSLNATM